MGIYGPITTSAAVGADGAAAGSVVSDHVVVGMICGIELQYNHAPPAGTTDVGVKTVGSSGVLPSRNLLTITNAATNGYFVPTVNMVDSAGADTGQDTLQYVRDYIQVDMAGANAGDTVSVWIYTI